MTRSLIILFLLLNFTFLSAQQLPWRLNEQELKISFQNETDRLMFAQLQLNADIYPEFARVYATPDEISKIEDAGFAYSIEKEDLNAWAMQYKSTLVPEGYYTFNQIKAIADSLAQNFPGICKKYIFGYNSLGQELAALKISDSVDFDQIEAEVLLDGGIHGDEVGASQNVIQFARDICLAYGSDSYITNLINTREIWLYYCVNPWGRDNMSRYNPNYIDINRDFGYMWDGSGASPSPFSQNESRALRNCMNMNQFSSYTNYHSGYQIIVYPWSYRYSMAPDKPHFEQLAYEYANASGYANLDYGQGSIKMYLIGGSTKDYSYACNGSVGWSMEISDDKQPEGPNIQLFYQYNKPAMLALIEHSGFGISGMITDSITGSPVSAMIFVQDNFPAYSDPEIGDYHKYLKSGVYDLKIVANGYKTKTIRSVQVVDMEETFVNVSLEREEGEFACKVVTVRLPYINTTAPTEAYYTSACLGRPDSVNFSLGKGGYLKIDMGRQIIDGEGNDIKFIEGDDTPESCTVLASQNIDGPYIPLGSVTGTTELDLSATSFSQAQYFMLQDDNDGQYNDLEAGYDLDAIQVLGFPVIENGLLSGVITDSETHLPLENAKIQIGDSILYSDPSGIYSVELTEGEYVLAATLDNYRDYLDTITLGAGETLVYDFEMHRKDTIAAFIPEKDFSLHIYPNPFSESFTIKTGSSVSREIQVSLFDETGRIILNSENRNIHAGSTEIQVFIEDNLNKN